MTTQTDAQLREKLRTIEQREVVAKNSDGSEVHKVISLTDKAIEEIVTLFHAAQQQLLTELMSHAEQQQIIVAYEKTFEHKPILQDWRAVSLEILEAKLKELRDGEKK